MVDLESTLGYGSWLVASVAAINWGTQEALDLNLLTEVGLSGSNLEMAYLAIGVIGAVNLYLLLNKVSEA